MNILMLLPTFLLILGLSLSFAKEDGKNTSKSLPSKIQYSGEDGDQSENNSIYGSSDSFNPYGGFPNSYGGFNIPQEILRNSYGGSDSNSQDQNQDNGYQNEQSSGRSGFPYPGNSDGSGFPYSGSSDGGEVPNGVFSNPFLGQRRTTSIPTYGGNDGGGYGGNDGGGYGGNGGGGYGGNGGLYPGYGGGSYLGGRYTPSYGIQPGIYQSPSVFYRPRAVQGSIFPTDQGYVYPLAGAGGIGVGLRQPNYPYGNGNGYGVYPGILRNVPTFYLPSSAGRGIYGGSPREGGGGRGYGPALFGYGRNPELSDTGLDFENGGLNASNPRGYQSGGNVAPQGSGFPYAQYPQSNQSSAPPNEMSSRRANSLRREDP